MAGKSAEQGKAISARILSIVVSLALSFFLWLALSSQDTSTSELTVPLELANMPANLAVKGDDLPTSVTFQVMANTAQLRFLSDRKLHVWINAASAREGYNAFTIAPDSLDLPRGVQVRRVTPQLIEFEAVKTANQILPLKPTLSGKVNPAFRVRDLVIEPDRVTVEGPKEVLDGLTELATTPISLEGLTSSTTLTVTPAVGDLADSGLVITPREIKVLINVEERTVEETFTALPVETDFKNGGGRPNGLLLTPERVDITVSWPASRARAVTARDIRVRVSVDANKLRDERELLLPVVAVPPNGATVTAIKPANVTVKLPPPAPGDASTQAAPPAGSSGGTEQP